MIGVLGMVSKLYNRMSWKEEHPGFLSVLSSLE